MSESEVKGLWTVLLICWLVFRSQVTSEIGWALNIIQSRGGRFKDNIVTTGTGSTSSVHKVTLEWIIPWRDREQTMPCYAYRVHRLPTKSLWNRRHLEEALCRPYCDYSQRVHCLSPNSHWSRRYRGVVTGRLHFDYASSAHKLTLE